MSRKNSFGGSIGCASEDNASVFLKKDQANSEADSDIQRKKLHNELKKAFEMYRATSDVNSLYASNHNVEFETISNGSASQKIGSQIDGMQLGKRKADATSDSNKDEITVKQEGIHSDYQEMIESSQNKR